MNEVVREPQFLSDLEAEKLIADGYSYTDAFERQIQELFVIDNSKKLLTATKEELLRGADFISYSRDRAKTYTHVCFPWRRHVVKTVAAEDYACLKTNRNRDLITLEQQKVLANYRVGVFGLSVGSNIAFALTQAGISNSITIADFDELDTTNLNRILAGVHQVGLNKADVVAERIYEDNPFARVTAFKQGMDEVSLRKLLESKQIDCILDEVDDIGFKIHARKLAIEFAVPVVMITDNGDGIVLHVERYDLGHALVFGRAASYFDSLLGNPISKEQAGKMIIEEIVGGADRVDPAMMSSVQKVLTRELVSWSQLGSAALLGGVVGTYIIKQIALKINTDQDIRAYIAPSSGLWQSHQV